MFKQKGYLVVLFSILAISLLALAGCTPGSAAATTTTSPTSPMVGSHPEKSTPYWVSKIGGTKQVSAGKEFSLVLNENPTTGYTWKASFDGSYIEQTASDYAQASPSAIGSGGSRSFKFNALKKGLTPVTLLLQRSGDEIPREVEVYLIAIDQPVGGTITTEGSKETNVGEEFTLVLEENPTTGYTWEAVLDPAYLEQVSSDYSKSSTGLIGGGGSRTFKFKAIKQGISAFALVLKRSWEDVPLEIKIYTANARLLVK